MAKFSSLDELFEGRHFDREIIVLCVRWYLRFKLSLRDLVEMMGERGLSLSHTTTLRSSKYLNNLIEQDHRNIKSRVAVMLGSKQFKNAAATIAGIELMHRIRKGQFNLAARVKGATAPVVWKEILSA